MVTQQLLLAKSLLQRRCQIAYEQKVQLKTLTKLLQRLEKVILMFQDSGLVSQLPSHRGPYSNLVENKLIESLTIILGTRIGI